MAGDGGLWRVIVGVGVIYKYINTYSYVDINQYLKIYMCIYIYKERYIIVQLDRGPFTVSSITELSIAVNLFISLK